MFFRLITGSQPEVQVMEEKHFFKIMIDFHKDQYFTKFQWGRLGGWTLISLRFSADVELKMPAAFQMPVIRVVFHCRVLTNEISTLFNETDLGRVN